MEALIMMKRFITQTPEAQDCAQQEDAQERGPIQESLAYRRLRRILRSFYQFFIFHRLFYGLFLFRFVLLFHERFRNGVPLYSWFSLKPLQRSPP